MLSPTLSLLDFFVRLPLIIFFLLLIFTCCTSILPSQVLPASCTGLPPSWVLLTSRTSHSLECPPASRTSLPTSQVPPPTCILHKSPNLLYFAQVSQLIEFPLASRTSFIPSWVPLSPVSRTNLLSSHLIFFSYASLRHLSVYRPFFLSLLRIAMMGRNIKDFK